MIEKTVLDYLSAQLSPVPVYMETPEDPPEKYVLIEKTGGSMHDQIWTATLAVKSISPTLYGAASLNASVISAMLCIVNDADVSACSLNSNYNFTDTRTKKYRYQAVFDLVY